MTVKEFCEKASSNMDNMDVGLYEINGNTALYTTIGEMSRNDGLHEEWKNAEIEGWFIDDKEYFILSVIKR